MPVTTDPLTMSQAPSKEYLQGWNDCHKHMAEEIVRQDTQIEQYDLTIRGMTEKNDELREAGRKSADEAISALDLLSRVRFALGDNGTRMQDELLDYCRELRDSAGALAALGEEYDALKGRVTKLREGILQARQEGCACDFHLYRMDEDLLTDEALDRYITQEQTLIKAKNGREDYRAALEEIPLCETLQDAIRVASRAVWPEPTV